DEPTNHLDIPSQEVLEAVLDDYAGTILLVTHDRYLIDALGTQIWEVEPDESRMIAFKGTYSQMRDEREKEATRLAATPDSQIPIPQKPFDKAQSRRKSQNAGTKDERRKLAHLQQLENKIAALEAQLAELGAQLENPPADAAEVTRLGKKYESTQREMDEKLAEWEKMQG
ncbi:MAG: hypothetical protein M1282_08430, partial [Chloroflexi bacterium]|nr:hypothetical protein [Chloroflexota bacterium]